MLNQHLQPETLTRPLASRTRLSQRTRSSGIDSDNMNSWKIGNPVILVMTIAVAVNEYRGSGCVSFQEGFLKTSNVLGKRLRELG